MTAPPEPTVDVTQETITFGNWTGNFAKVVAHGFDPNDNVEVRVSYVFPTKGGGTSESASSGHDTSDDSGDLNPILVYLPLTGGTLKWSFTSDVVTGQQDIIF